ncbi:MAG TPA: Gfo/Idh/MocA family oxidoreductase [Aggregatilineales bacterium]|nr:Gfo/Idh/MocA family oxidoreductase [Aggregatilineales bacterium]
MADQTVRVGMIGTSWWADVMHVPALMNHPGAEVVAICGRNAERTQAKAAQWNIPNAYTDYREMIGNNTLAMDAVVIATPNESHHAIAMTAMNAGLHVLCEKPLAMNYAEAKEMADTAAAKGLITLVPFTYAFMPTARYMKELVDDGYLGKPYHLNLRYYAGYGRDGKYGWRFDKGIAGSGILGDLGSHFVYLADMFFGDIRRVSCLLSYHVPREESNADGNPYEVADDGAIITVEFASGAQGVIQVTAAAYEATPFGQIHQMELYGSGGTLRSVTDWDTIQQVSGARDGEGAVTELEIPDHIWGGARRDYIPDTYTDIFHLQDHMVRQFITGVLEKTRQKPDFEDGARIQQVIDAALQSHLQNGCRIEIT